MIRKALYYGGIALIGMLMVGLFAWNLTPTMFAAEANQPAAQSQQDETDRGRPGRRDKKIVGTLIRATAEVSGIDEAAVREGLSNGQSLAQIAEANGSSGDAVVQQVVVQATQRLDQAVADGRLTQEEADEMLNRLTEAATRLVNDATLGEKAAQVRETTIIAGLIRATAQVSNLSVDEVVDGVRAGQSLGQIAEANGSRGDAVVQQVVDRRSARLDQAVAAGRLTQEEADEAIATLTDRATELVNDPNLQAQLDERLENAKDRQARRALVQTTVEVTNLPISTVVERLRSGESLAQIAEANGSSGDAVVQTAIDNFSNRATELVNETR